MVIASCRAIRFSARVKTLPLLALAIFVVPLLPAQEQDVVFHRAMKVGYKFDIEGQLTDEQSQKIEANGVTMRDNTTRTEATLKGRVEVTGVSKHEMPQRVRVTVKEWTLKLGGRSQSEIKPGDVIEGEGGKASEFKLNGVKLSKDQTRALGRLLSLKSDDEPDTDDLVLGAGRKVKAGDAWPINLVPAAKDLSEAFHAEIAPSMVKGLVKFNGSKEIAAEPCQQLEAHLTLNGAGLDVPGAPTGTKARTFMVTVDMKTDLPADTTKQPRTLEDEISSQVVGESEINRDGKSAVMRFNLGSRVAKRCTMNPVP
jgi:hypothetical protein